MTKNFHKLMGRDSAFADGFICRQSILSGEVLEIKYNKNFEWAAFNNYCIASRTTSSVPYLIRKSLFFYKDSFKC